MSKLNYKNIFNKELKSAGSSGSADAAPRMTESGRSMVEMLGVLAVMGVLSVAGIAGYNNAMNRHRANELLYEASKRATVVAMQVASGNGSQLSVAEFGDNAWSVTSENLTNQFGIKTPSVGAEVCKQVVNSVGTGTVVRKVLSGATDATNDASKCTDAIITLVYNNDLSTTDIAPVQVTCENSEKVEHTYYVGACCTVAIKGKFCPGENVPTCTKVNEDACACTTPECCNNAEGEWKTSSTGGICVPNDSNYFCGNYGACIACKSDEIPKCGSYCVCGSTEDATACLQNRCIVCKSGEFAKCMDNSNEVACACGPTIDAVACRNYFNPSKGPSVECKVCMSNQKAVCTSSSCTCEDL